MSGIRDFQHRLPVHVDQWWEFENRVHEWASSIVQLLRFAIMKAEGNEQFE